MNTLKNALVIVIVLAQVALCGQEEQFPISFAFHCGGRSFPKAMGFSSDGKTLAVWYSRSLILVNANAGREIRRLQTAEELSFADPYNFVAFEDSGRFCAIASVHSSGFDFQIFDLEHNLASLPLKQRYAGSRNWTRASRYKSTEWYLPLEQLIAFREVTEKEANFEAVFAKSDGLYARRNFELLFDGGESLKEAERMWKAIRSKRAIEAWDEKEFTSTGGGVALSTDRQTLLNQSILRSGSQAWYQFRFYDVESESLVTEATFETGVRWRTGVSRGFAFSPNFNKLARSMPRGYIFVHDLSAMVDRTLDDRSISIPADYGPIEKKK